MSQSDAELLLNRLEVSQNPLCWPALLSTASGSYFQVRRGAGALESSKRIDKELSKRVHKFMTSVNPHDVLPGIQPS